MTCKRLKAVLSEVLFWLGLGGVLLLPVLALLTCAYLAFTATDTLSLRLHKRSVN